MAVPLPTRMIVKKRVKQLKRPHIDLDKCLKPSWRRPKGIDSRVRRKFKGCTLMPNIGYGSEKEDKALPSQLVQEVCGAQYLRAGVAYDALQDTLLRSPTTFVQRSARRLWSVLAQLDIVVTNKLARLRSQEDG